MLYKEEREQESRKQADCFIQQTNKQQNADQASAKIVW